MYGFLSTEAYPNDVCGRDGFRIPELRDEIELRVAWRGAGAGARDDAEVESEWPRIVFLPVDADNLVVGGGGRLDLEVSSLATPVFRAGDVSGVGVARLEALLALVVISPNVDRV